MNTEKHIRQKLLAFSCKDLGSISKRLNSNSLETKDIETIQEAVSIFDAIGDLLGDRELVWRKVFENSFRTPEK